MIKLKAKNIRIPNILNKSFNTFKFSTTYDGNSDIKARFSNTENSTFLNKIISQKNSIITSIFSIGLAYNGNMI